MKKILFVAQHLTIGGIQKSLVTALDSLDYKDNDVTLYIRKRRLDLLPYINENVTIVVNDDKNHYYRYPKAVFLQLLIMISKVFKNEKVTQKLNASLAEFIRESEAGYEQKKFFKNQTYDVAISYWQGYNTLFVDKYVNAKKKIMFYQTSMDERHEVHEKAMPNYDAIVVEHEDIKQSLASWYDNIFEKIVVLENYTSPQMLEKMSKEKEIDRENDKVTLCTCARFAKVKGMDLAVKAARILKEKNVNFHWYLVGDGPVRLQVEDLINEYQLNDYITLTGMQKNPYPYMVASDIYVQPSYEEALSIAMLESQVLNIPMVSTKTAGGLAMVQDGVNGFLADINESSLANAIEKLILDAEIRNKMKDYLSKIDYSKERERYVREWSELLQG